MEEVLIAKILAGGNEDEKPKIGTGLPISQDLVITARHVILDEEKKLVSKINIEWSSIPYNSKNHWKTKAEVIYDNRDYDIAVLKCHSKTPQTSALILLAERFPSEHEKWASYGYPRVAEDSLNDKRDLASFTGTFNPPTKHNISLSTSCEPFKKEGWLGMSGAPIYQGISLYAVVVSTNKNMARQINAVSIPWLLKSDKKFSKAVGIKQLKQDFHTAIQHLHANESIKWKIYDSITNKGQDNIGVGANDIIQYLVKLPIAQLLEIIYQLYRKINNNEEKQELLNLILMLLPTMFGHCSKITSTIQESVSILEMPCSTEATAEMLMAAQDGRPAEIKIMSGKIGPELSPGRYRLPLPAENGPSDSQQQQRDIVKEFANRLLPGNVMDMFASFERTLYQNCPNRLTDDLKPEDQHLLIKSWLEDNAELKRPRYYWLVGAMNENWQIFANELHRKYPEIVFLCLQVNPSQARIEFRQLERLKELLS